MQRDKPALDGPIEAGGLTQVGKQPQHFAGGSSTTNKVGSVDHSSTMFVEVLTHGGELRVGGKGLQ